MPWDAHGEDGAGGAGSPGVLASVPDLAAALPGAPAVNAADEELTREQRIGHTVALLKELTDKRKEEEDEAKWPAVDAQIAKLAATISALEAEADADAAKEAAVAPPPAAAAAADAAPAAAAAASPPKKEQAVIATASFGEFKEVWAHKGFTEDEVAEFHKGLQAMPWPDLQAKLAARKTCKLM
jgi:hypothetical protein